MTKLKTLGKFLLSQKVLNGKNYCGIDLYRRVIYIFKNVKNDLGNKSWGHIDYLVNHLKFKLIYTTKHK